jgi:hypothetical protein
MLLYPFYQLGICSEASRGHYSRLKREVPEDCSDEDEVAASLFQRLLGSPGTPIPKKGHKGHREKNDSDSTAGHPSLLDNVSDYECDQGDKMSEFSFDMEESK